MASHATSAAAHQSLGDREPTQVSELRRGGPDDRTAGRTSATHFNRTRPNRVAVQITGVALTILAIAAMTELVTVTPWEFGFGLAVASAIAWCIWLEFESS